MLSRRAALTRLAWLGGASITAPVWSSILTACNTAGDAYTSSVLSPDQFTLMTRLVDIIIPETDTPGALAAGVPVFIDQILEKVYDEADRQRFIAGLVYIDQVGMDVDMKPFVQIDSTLQLSLMGDLERTARTYTRQGPKDIPIFAEVKNLAMNGYFTSEIGATQALKYVAIPGAYKGCEPLSEYPQTWAT